MLSALHETRTGWGHDRMALELDNESLPWDGMDPFLLTWPVVGVLIVLVILL